MSTSPGGESEEISTTRHSEDLAAGNAVLLARDKIVLISALTGIAGAVAAVLYLALSARLDSRGWLLPAIVASLYFYASFISSLKLFQSNADYLAKLARNEPAGSDGEQLQSGRSEAVDALALGVIFAIIMAIVAAFSR